MAGVSALRVTSESAMEMAISSYIAKGFVMANRTPTGATMFKKKEFSILYLVVGFFLCVIPLLIYLIVYSFERDQMVQIQLVSATTQPQLQATSAQMVGTRSADGHWWWDGAAWQPVPQQTPPATPSLPQPAAASDWLPAPEPGPEQSSDPGPVMPPKAEPTPPQ
jgi:hypothetical protein